MKRFLFICSFLLTVTVLWSQVPEARDPDSLLPIPYAAYN